MADDNKKITFEEAVEGLKNMGARVEERSARETWEYLKQKIDTRLYWTLFVFNQEAAEFLHQVEERYYMETPEARAGCELFVNVPLPSGLVCVAILKKEFMTPAQYGEMIAAAAGCPVDPTALEKQDMLLPALPPQLNMRLFGEISAMLEYLDTLEKLGEPPEGPTPSVH